MTEPVPGPRPVHDPEAVVAAHQAALLRMAGRLLRDPEAAQDVVQEAFLRWLREAPPGLDDPRSLAAWLFRVTHNLCVDWIRKERRMRARAEENGAPPPAPPHSERMLAEETRERVGRLLDRLTENQRTVIVLRVYEGKSYREIGEITGLTTGNVGFHIHQALKKLAVLIREAEVV